MVGFLLFQRFPKSRFNALESARPFPDNVFRPKLMPRLQIPFPSSSRSLYPFSSSVFLRILMKEYQLGTFDIPPPSNT